MSSRQLGRVAPDTVAEIRRMALEELARALVAGADDETLKDVASLVVRCERRLLALAHDGPPPSVTRRQEIAGEALVAATDARGPRRARASTSRTTVPGAPPRVAASADC